MSAILTPPALSDSAQAFVADVKQQAAVIFEAYRDTGTITANGTVGFIERIPGEDKLVSVNYPGPFEKHKPLTATVTGLDGTVYLGAAKAGQGRYTRLFIEHPEITTVSHVHSPYLGAWAQTHRTLPIRYVPVQRFKLFRELPIYIDRRQQEVDFILDKLRENSHTSAILEANGGATVWGTKGLRDTAEFILLLEEGAQIQTLAEALGGSRDLGPGVLAQQWKMGKLYEQARALNLLPATDL
ncbi:ribulose phosphate epimerase [Roseateles aquatilis]|uniref:Ribulose phosphate epimerase n=1 Tax=Roseateles aquatilis TaxID=431061 RepID=A0A246JGU1_9BURK|nr:class II aldolase/adducin family protein [Roseateles aquatilis]OWQ91868.1 ribulose phosphate epimerase [Roseateles aquatilis]